MAEMTPVFQHLQAVWGKNIRTARGDRTQAWLAKAIDVDQTTISRIERGIYRLSPELMLALAAELDQELATLFPYPPGYVDMEKHRRSAGKPKTEAVA